jgi:hypothetical protein
MAEPPPVRVVTYNVLSSHLCEPNYYVKCDPADLDPPTRLDRVKRQLEPHVSRPMRAIHSTFSPFTVHPQPVHSNVHSSFTAPV